MLTRCHFLNIQLRAVLADKLLKQLMRFLQFLLEFLLPLLRIFTHKGNRTLKLTRRHHIHIDIVFFQQAVNIRNLSNHTHRTDNGKRSGNNFICNTCHHIPSACCHLIDGDSQRNIAFPQTPKLGGCQTVTMNHSAGTLQSEQNLIFGPDNRKHGGNLVA